MLKLENSNQDRELGHGTSPDDVFLDEDDTSNTPGVTILQRFIMPHSSSKATKNELSCPDEIPLQMLPMGIWGPENMKIENI